MNHSFLSEHDAPLQRIPRKERPELFTIILPLLAFASGVLLLLGLLDLLGASSLIDYLKCGIMALSAGIVALGVNRLAIERGARAAAIGTPGAALLSLLMMGVVAAGLFAATFAGFTLQEVERLRFAEFNTAQVGYIGNEKVSALEAAKVIPGVRAIVDDLKAKESCEALEGCLSGGVGDGPFSRALGTERQRAEAILGTIQDSVALRISNFGTLDRLQTDFHALLGNDALSGDELRARANDLAMHVSQTAAGLVETDPVAFVTSFADELATPNSPNQALNDLRRSYAGQLRSLIANVAPVRADAPALPAKTGVADTLGYLFHFLPIALLVLAIEAVMPFAIWFFAYFALLARLVEQDDPRPTTTLTDVIRRNGHALPPRTPH